MDFAHSPLGSGQAQRQLVAFQAPLEEFERVLRRLLVRRILVDRMKVVAVIGQDWRRADPPNV
jgi:hypothetical protein